MNTKNVNLLLENNFCSKVTLLPSLCSDMDFIELSNGLCYVNSNYASDTFNVVCFRNLNEPITITQAKTITEYFNAKNLPFAWWIGFNSASFGVHEVLKLSGLKHVETEIGMAVKTSEIILNNLDTIENFYIKNVSSSKDLKDYGYVVASVFEPFDHEAIKFYEKIGEFYRFNNNAQVQMFIGYLYNEPVSTCFVIDADGIGGIYDIITNPKFQKRGIGKSMTQVAINHLKKLNCNIIGMQASADGMKIYTKFGFKVFDEFKVYSNKHLLESTYE